MTDSADTATDSRRKRRRTGYWQLLLIVLVLAGAFVVARYLAGLDMTPRLEGANEPRHVLVETTRVSPATHRLTFTTTGTIQARTQTDLVPQVGGKVVSVSEQAFPGGRVKPDAPLFEIDKSDFLLRLRQMEAEVARANTQLKMQQARSEVALAEWQAMNPDEKAPPLVQETPQLKQARTALDAARARLAAARLDLLRTDYALPFEGRIVTFELETGQVAVAGKAYGTAYRFDALEVVTPLSSQQVNWLLEAESPTATVREDESAAVICSASLRRIASTVDRKTQLIDAYFEMQGDQASVSPGTFVTVRVAGPRRTNVWKLPLDTLQERGMIWTVTAEDTLTARSPTILQITDRYAIARADVQPVDVVRGTLSGVAEGDPVRRVAENQPGTSADGDRD